tara:strand:+ start:158 stop:1924 length:1767 start_codon:yes stop_codon:yes gene_type:complete
MKNLKLLSKKLLIVFFISSISFNSYSSDKPIDIWKLNEKKNDQNPESNLLIEENNNSSSEISIYNKKKSNNETLGIVQDTSLNSKMIKITGLYDPQDYDLNINMWSNSDGDQLKDLFGRIAKLNLSKDASELMNISILINAHYPKKNITEKEFLKLKSEWLIKNSDFNLIKEYLNKNNILNDSPELSKYFVDHYISVYKLKKACDIFSDNLEPITDEYLSKLYIYCLINSGKTEKAQLILDLKKELGFKDKYFEKKIDYLLGYTSKIDTTVSEKSIFDFHLAHKTNPNFEFEPDEKTSKIIWKYLSSANLLSSFKEIDITEQEKISNIEKAVHNKNYSENELFKIYMRFQFSINQLLNAKESYKSLSNIEARALLYQKILLESEMIEKLKLLKILKKLFEKDNLNDAFDNELKKFLKDMDPIEIPDNLTSFYYTNVMLENKSPIEIKYNNDVLYQSKLINYFNGDYSKSKIEKDVNNFLKRVKKNKKYSFSKKDVIFLESLKSDGIKISEKFDDLYVLSENEMPTDIQIMINNNEAGAALLRIVEVIGQDKLERMDEDTIYFIISALNQLNIDSIRNKILFKVLPLKV